MPVISINIHDTLAPTPKLGRIVNSCIIVPVYSLFFILKLMLVHNFRH